MKLCQIINVQSFWGHSENGLEAFFSTDSSSALKGFLDNAYVMTYSMKKA